MFDMCSTMDSIVGSTMNNTMDSPMGISLVSNIGSVMGNSRNNMGCIVVG